jgi:hypothetical protein
MAVGGEPIVVAGLALDAGPFAVVVEGTVVEVVDTNGRIATCEWR